MTTTTEDFRTTKTFTAAPDAVFSALTDLDALTAWWNPAGGGTATGDTLRFLMGDQEVVMLVEEANRPSRVRWNVLACEPAPDWVGTSIVFDLEPNASGTDLHFHHEGLNPELECFEQCHAGWTHYLASLVAHVDHSDGFPNRHADPDGVAAWRAKHAVR